ncbi:MAG: AAA family ATPase [Treponema sp.]|jgi:hypothetical protein|nr:AAA family ATPase [Treponema sp.]
MITFDEIIPEIKIVLQEQTENLKKIDRLIINRDLNGIVRLVVDEKFEDNAEVKEAIRLIGQRITAHLGPRFADKNNIMYESSLDDLIKDVPNFALKDFPKVIIIDRLLAESDWTNVSVVKPGTHRIVFYSIKGGVGRSTALSMVSWALAEEGRKVMVLDLDLESPGLSSSLLPEEKCPAYGIVDWLIEDLVENSETVFPYIVALSDLSHNGAIQVVPAHGKDPGEYISKLGRVWMSKNKPLNSRELWQNRLNRLLDELEKKWKPDVVLIDSRAGIDEVSSACLSSLGAESILLFAIDSTQTWSGYKLLFHHWLRNYDSVRTIRERLQIVGALIPELDQDEYIAGLCENAWNLFTDELYEPVPADEDEDAYFNFDKSDKDAPHFPLSIQGNRGLAVLPNLYSPLQQSAVKEKIYAIFGQIIDHIKGIIANE